MKKEQRTDNKNDVGKGRHFYNYPQTPPSLPVAIATLKTPLTYCMAMSKGRKSKAAVDSVNWDEGLVKEQINDVSQSTPAIN